MGIDPSQVATGWAVGNTTVRTRPTSGVFRQRSWTKGSSGELSATWEDWLYHMVDQYSVQAIFCEASILPPNAKGGRDSMMVRYAQFNMVGIVDRLVHRKKLQGGIIDISDWRMRFNGATRRPKHMTMSQGTAWHKKNALAACAKRGWFITDHNEAEALGVLDYGMAAVDRAYASWSDPLMRWAETERDRERQAS